MWLSKHSPEGSKKEDFLQDMTRTWAGRLIMRCLQQIPKVLKCIVACHLPRGSKLRWREDMGGGLPNGRALAEASNLLGYKWLWSGKSVGIVEGNRD